VAEGEKDELRRGRNCKPMEELPFAAQGHENGLGGCGGDARGPELEKPSDSTDGNGGYGGGVRDLGDRRFGAPKFGDDDLRGAFREVRGPSHGLRRFWRRGRPRSESALSEMS